MVKGRENDFSFRTGCGLQNELRTAVLELLSFGEFPKPVKLATANSEQNPDKFEENAKETHILRSRNNISFAKNIFFY